MSLSIVMVGRRAAAGDPVALSRARYRPSRHFKWRPPNGVCREFLEWSVAQPPKKHHGAPDYGLASWICFPGELTGGRVVNRFQTSYVLIFTVTDGMILDHHLQATTSSLLNAFPRLWS